MKLTLRLLALLVLLPLARPLDARQADKALQGRPQDEPPAWAATWDEALAQARKTPDGRVLVELREAACADCERMEKLVYPSASFRAFCRDKVPVSLLVGTAEGDVIARRYAVRSFPAWLVVSTDGLLCGKQEGASNQSTWIDRFVATERDWNLFLGKLEAERQAPDDLAAVYAVAEEAYRRFGDDMAEARFRRIADDRKAPMALREKSLPYLATMSLAARRFDDAERDLKRLLSVTKDPAVREKAELRLVDVAVGRGERRRAEGMLEAFLKKHPESPLRPQAEALLEALRAPKS